MKILIIGSGGREHAITWKLAQSPLVTELYAAPGNPGIGEHAICIDIQATAMDDLLQFALYEKIDLTVVGPEQPLAMGIVDLFEAAGLKVFGPNQAAARIEASKVFFKELMAKYHIPTAHYASFRDYQEAIAYLAEQTFPIVIKADGLAAGKGVIIAENQYEAQEAVHSMMEDKLFGDAGREVVIEEFLVGQEVSLLAFTDGETIVPMVTAQDHKQAYDGDIGPNTGGMGAYSPTTILSGVSYRIAVETILEPTLQALKAEGITYRGVLYAGLMLTKDGPKTLEYNCRFGDPETQVVLPRLQSDLVEIMMACANGTLHEQRVQWSDEAAVCVILASGGYPTNYQKGYPISGLEQVADDILVFHAGTAIKGGEIVTNGGRVLGVTALAKSIKEATAKAYVAVSEIRFKGMQYRSDIAQRQK